MNISEQNFTATQVFYSLMLTAPKEIIWKQDKKSKAVQLNSGAIDFIIAESQGIAKKLLAAGLPLNNVPITVLPTEQVETQTPNKDADSNTTSN